MGEKITGRLLLTYATQPTDSPVAILLLVHGFSDHVNRYKTLFPILASRGIQCHSFDQRGWGQTVQAPAQKGLSGPTTTVLEDITTIIKTILPISEQNHIPFFLMGHSMGGAEILQYGARGPTDIRAQIRGYIAESPYIALHPSTQPNRMTVIGGRMVAKIVPRRHMYQKLDAKWVSRDEEVCRDYNEDPLCHNTGTLEGLAGMLDRAHELNTGAVMPTEGRYWIGHGDADHVTSYDASKGFFERLKVSDKEFKTYPGWYHQCEWDLSQENLVKLF